MSFSQVLASTPVHFGHFSDAYPLSIFSDSMVDTGLQSMPQQSYFDVLSLQGATELSPQLRPISPGNRSSARRSLPSSRTPPFRGRTPIRHNRPDESRARSGSQSETLLAYATEQHQQKQQQNAPMSIVPSQSAPNTPPIYGPSAFLAPTVPTSYAGETTFYGQPPVPQFANNYFTNPVLLSTGQVQPDLYDLARRSSHAGVLEISTVNPQEALYLPPPVISSTPPLPSLPSNILPFPAVTLPLESSSAESFRVLAARPKPQCWEHGCNGRQFSTFSNLLRHQREKNGNVTKVVCPHCGTEFTRTTARNGHLYGGKCKGRPEQIQTQPDQESNDSKNSD